MRAARRAGSTQAASPASPVTATITASWPHGSSSGTSSTAVRTIVSSPTQANTRPSATPIAVATSDSSTASVASTAAQLAAAEPQRAQQGVLAAALEHRQPQGVADAQQGDHDGDRQQAHDGARDDVELEVDVLALVEVVGDVGAGRSGQGLEVATEVVGVDVAGAHPHRPDDRVAVERRERARGDQRGVAPAPAADDAQPLGAGVGGDGDGAARQLVAAGVVREPQLAGSRRQRASQHAVVSGRQHRGGAEAADPGPLPGTARVRSTPWVAATSPASPAGSGASVPVTVASTGCWVSISSSTAPRELASPVSTAVVRVTPTSEGRGRGRRPPRVADGVAGGQRRGGPEQANRQQPDETGDQQWAEQQHAGERRAAAGHHDERVLVGHGEGEQHGSCGGERGARLMRTIPARERTSGPASGRSAARGATRAARRSGSEAATRVTTVPITKAPAYQAHGTAGVPKPASGTAAEMATARPRPARVPSTSPTSDATTPSVSRLRGDRRRS